MVKVAENDNLSLPSLYERDFYAWANEQALALKTGNIEGLDKENTIAELECLGASELRELMSSVEQALIHLMKLSYSAATDPRSGWEESVRKQRHAIETTLADSPSLKRKLEEKYQEAWTYSRKESLRQLQDVNEFPTVPVDCPFTVEKVLDENYFPQVQNRAPKP